MGHELTRYVGRYQGDVAGIEIDVEADVAQHRAQKLKGCKSRLTWREQQPEDRFLEEKRDEHQQDNDTAHPDEHLAQYVKMLAECQAVVIL